MKSSPDFSLLMAVYDGDSPAFLHDALQSVLDNTVQPNEVILVVDGPINDGLSRVIENFLPILPIQSVNLDKNEGLGRALHRGILACKHEWIARFDSDDICFPDRFEKQLLFIEQNLEVDAFSAPIIEFEKELTEGPFVVREVPRGHSAILGYAKWRNPLNHMSVMFRKSCVLQAGNYQDEPSFEDYSLWLRMLLNGAHLDNMDEVVVYARAGAAIQDRRGGLRYIKRELDMHRKMLKWGFISFPQFILMLVLKSLIRISPSKLRFIFYHAFTRRKIEKSSIKATQS